MLSSFTHSAVATPQPFATVSNPEVYKDLYTKLARVAVYP